MRTSVRAARHYKPIGATRRVEDPPTDESGTTTSSTKPAAIDYCGIGGGAMLVKLRIANAGPAFIKIGKRRVGYDIRDLNDWLDRGRREPTLLEAQLE